MDKARKGEFLEHAEYLGHLYGTPRDQVEETLGHGGVVLLEIDLQGARQVMRKLPDALCVFIMPPDDRVLEARLRNRKTDDEASIQARLRRARQEMTEHDYEHEVRNDDLSQAVKEVASLIKGRR